MLTNVFFTLKLNAQKKGPRPGVQRISSMIATRIGNDKDRILIAIRWVSRLLEWLVSYNRQHPRLLCGAFLTSSF